MNSGTTTQNVLATYADMAQARRAIDALQYAGIDPIDIELLGEAAQAARRSDERKNSARRDVPMMWRILWRGALWSVIAAPAGVVLGVVLALAGFTVVNIWITIAVWALFSHLFGGLAGAYFALGMGDAWGNTFGDHAGLPVVVSVSSRSAATTARAETILRARGAQAVALRADADARRLLHGT